MTTVLVVHLSFTIAGSHDSIQWYLSKDFLLLHSIPLLLNDDRPIPNVFTLACTERTGQGKQKVGVAVEGDQQARETKRLSVHTDGTGESSKAFATKLKYCIIQ